MIEDTELLRRYVRDGSDDAFAELVRRRIDLVYSVALRQVGGDAHFAHDVTQRVFVDLARKAPALIGRPSVSGWLFRSAQFAASDLVRAERRRRARELENHAMTNQCTSSGKSGDWEKLRPLLDDAMGELNDEDRDAVALRFFEQQAFAEIGRALRLSEDSARKRVERALEKLRAALARRGVTSTPIALATVLAGHVGIGAPNGLAATVTATALRGLTLGGGAGAAATSLRTGLELIWNSAALRIGVAALAVAALVFETSRVQRASSELAAAQSAAHVMRRRATVEEQSAASLLERFQAAQKDNAELRAAIETASLAGVVEEDASRVAFVIDTSGSMREPQVGGLYVSVVDKIEGVLGANADLKYFQVFDADGRYIIADTAEKWLPNNIEMREAAKRALRGYNQDSISNPVPGIERAVDALDAARDPMSRLHVFVLGDEFIERQDAAVARLENLNPADAKGRRRIAISGVQFPTWESHTGPGLTHRKYLWLMNELSRRHGGSVETLASLEPSVR